MKKLISAILACALGVSILSGCGSAETVDCKAYGAELLSAGDVAAPVISTVVGDGQQAAAQNFAAGLLLNSMEEGKNTLVSPLSVLSALAMTANGAKNNTLLQMEEAFGMSTDELCALLQACSGGAELDTANSIWLRDDYTEMVNPDFLAKNTEWLKSETFAAPFDDRTCTDINNWVSDHTKQRIPQILDQIGPDAMMYLVNAICFDGDWADPFEPNLTWENTFTTASGVEQTVQTMYDTEYTYLEDENAVGFLKPYEGGRYAFAALLPKSGMSLTEYVTTLRDGHIKDILDGRTIIEVRMSMPRFKVEYGTELSKTLQVMGITDAFSDAADFSGIAGAPGDLSISRVLHKTYMKVDEKGTEAAAATIVEMTEATMMEDPEPYKEVYLNRPFVYMVIDTQQNLPVFIGTMAEIEQ